MDWEQCYSFNMCKISNNNFIILSKFQREWLSINIFIVFIHINFRQRNPMSLIYELHNTLAIFDTIIDSLIKMR
jgi:hypothetical protein